VRENVDAASIISVFLRTGRCNVRRGEEEKLFLPQPLVSVVIINTTNIPVSSQSNIRSAFITGDVHMSA
jgi:hypothetical protein